MILPVIPMDITWKNNRPLPITLNGDAAHFMPPFAGQGLNIGLPDAFHLSNCLTEAKRATIETIISHYENQMFEYAVKAQAETSRKETAMWNQDFSFLRFNQES